MRIYVASHCRWAGLHVASVLTNEGHEVNSRWLHEPFNPTTAYSAQERERIAQMDKDDVQSADALVLIAGPDKYSGGKFVETGIAIALKKKVVVLGRRENMLLFLPEITAAEDTDDLVRLLKGH